MNESGESRMNGMKAGAESEREHSGLFSASCSPHNLALAVKTVLEGGNKRFSVTEPFSHGDRQQLALSRTSCRPFSHDAGEYVSSSCLIPGDED